MGYLSRGAGLEALRRIAAVTLPKPDLSAAERTTSCTFRKRTNDRYQYRIRCRD